uniref:Concentrative nucleoside transporter N-terminal domain-containing protein n=1 Tax=Hucho hucho TaxID=62062 RepID=A0A4W5KM13_9TELE
MDGSTDIWKNTGYVATVIAVCVQNLQRPLAMLAVFFLLWDWLMGRYRSCLWDTLQPARSTLNTHRVWLKWVVCILLLVAVVCWLVFDTAKQGTRQLVFLWSSALYCSCWCSQGTHSVYGKARTHTHTLKLCMVPKTDRCSSDRSCAYMCDSLPVCALNCVWVSRKTLLWGVVLQFLFGLIILRTKAGFTAVDWLAHQV